MNLRMAREAAKDWVMRHAAAQVGYWGAYYAGSTVGLSDEAQLPVGSDIDIVVVLEQEVPPQKLGKFVYRDTLLEVTYLTWVQLASVEEVLANYHLAGSFRCNTIIDDPTGRLGKLQQQVAMQWNEENWVRRRCENVRARIEQGLRGLDQSAPWHVQVTAWLFPTGVTTHLLLTAALRNPTVRLRYLAARIVLADYGQSELYGQLLELLGCSDLSPERTAMHVEALAHTFDSAASVAKTPFFFSSDITSAARPIAIDASRELIRSGNHREAVFWLTATFARCHAILAADAPELAESHRSAFDALLADLGIRSSEDIGLRAKQVLRFLPELSHTAEAIIRANPDIVKR